MMVACVLTLQAGMSDVLELLEQVCSFRMLGLRPLRPAAPGVYSELAAEYQRRGMDELCVHHD